MKVSEFFNTTKGSRQLCFSGETPMCGRDFWGKYRQTEKWNAEVDHVSMVAKRSEQDGLWFDTVVCTITTK